MPDNTPRKPMQEILESIETGIKELFASEKYAQYLRTMSRFHRYSVNNQILIHLQRPDATLVAGFDKWQKQFGRNVKKGEKSIRIIAPTPYKKKIEQDKLDPDTKLPMRDEDGNIIREEKEIKIPMYKPVSVFDVSQTDGKLLPQLVSDLTGNVQNYEVFMEALKRASPVPIAFEPLGIGLDGYFASSEHRIAIRDGMSEVQTISAVIHEIAHAILHDSEKPIEENETVVHKNRRTEEVEAESISYAVCAYYGIATGENSFGYIASWSKDKELKELRESLETISKTSSELITDIDRHYTEILKERETEIVDKNPVQQSATEEALYLVDDAVYLHVQLTDDGCDYSLYDKETKKLIDGGVIETAAIEESPISSVAGAVRTEVFAIQGITPTKVTFADIAIVEELQAAQLTEANTVDAVMARQVQEEANTGRMPDPSISIEEMQAFGYTDPVMLPLSKDRALELMEKAVTVYTLYPDNTESMVFEQENIRKHDGLFGIEREEWDKVREQIQPKVRSAPEQKIPIHEKLEQLKTKEQPQKSKTKRKSAERNTL